MVGTMEKLKTVLGVKEIQEIIPHRYPMLLVDKILEVDLEGEKIVGQKSVTMNEHFFQGHFPQTPIMPGVLIIEALAQTGAVYLHYRGYHKLAVLLGMDRAKFRQPVKPGDILRLECEGMHFTNRAGKIRGRATVDGKLAAEVEIGFALVDQEQM